MHSVVHGLRSHRIVFTLLIICSILFIAALAAFGYVLFLGRSANPPLPGTTVTIRGVAYHAEVADSELTRMRGLSGREELAPGTAMLFRFPAEGSHGFWMKDMKFPIDIIWIRNGRIAGLSGHAVPQPGDPVYKLKMYHPPEPVSLVLEVPGGDGETYGFQVGDAVTVAADGATSL